MTTPTPLNRAALAASAVITVHEDYGARRCHSCAFWEPFRDHPWGQCGLVEGETEGVPYIVGDEGILVTPREHGCLGWKSRTRQEAA